MLLEFTSASIFHRPRTGGARHTEPGAAVTAASAATAWPAGDHQAVPEAALLARFAQRINAFGPLRHAPPALQARVLEEVRAAARRFDPRGEPGSPDGYARRVLVEQPERWSLAAIILRPGQETQPHDHGGWGCAVTVQGLERDRRFSRGAAGRLALTAQHDYPPGAGYLFDPTDVHQPLGAHPRLVTVALHFLVHEPHE